MTDTSFETGTIQSRDGTGLSYRYLEGPDAGAALLFVHGFGEHSGRYEHVMRWFHERGYDVSAFDYRGHGRAEGERAYVERFTHYLDDLDAFIRWAMSRLGTSRRIYLVGHSLGGLIVSSYVLDQPEGIDGVVLSSPFFGVKVKVPPLKIAAARLMSAIYPKLALPAGIPPEHLSTDPAVGRAYEADPLVLTDVTARFYTEAIARQEHVLKHAERIQLPLLLLQAGDDRIADAEVAQNMLAALGSTDKELRWYDGMYHEIFNEVEKEQVFEDLLSWLEKHA